MPADDAQSAGPSRPMTARGPSLRRPLSDLLSQARSMAHGQGKELRKFGSSVIGEIPYICCENDILN